MAHKNENNNEFFNRISYSKNQTEKEVEEKRQEIKYYEEVFDVKNNQEFFNPKITQYENAQNIDRKAQGYKNVYEALHEEARILKDKKQNLKKIKKQQNKLVEEQYRQNSKNHKSDKILLKTHIHKLKKIFELLDSDYDGYISAQKIDLSSLPNSLLDIMTPFLLKIEEHELQIDFQQFSKIVLEFSQQLSVTDRNTLLGPEREFLKSPPQDPTFAPELSANTRAIIEFGGEDKRNVKLWEDHRVRGSEEKENKEMYECTFHPQILDYNPKNYEKRISSKMDLRDTMCMNY